MVTTVIKILLWLLAFVPLIVDNGVFFPYVAGKEYVFQLLILLAAILYIANIVLSSDFREEQKSKSFRIVKNGIFFWSGIFFILSLSSVLFSHDVALALWGVIERAGGVINLLFGLVLLYLFAAVFVRRDWRVFICISVMSGAVLLAFGFSEYLGGASRPVSLSGNPSFFSANLLFVLFCLGILIQNVRSLFLRFSLTFLFCLTIWGVMITGTRGSLLGMFLGFIVVLIYFIIKGDRIFYFGMSLKKISAIALGLLFGLVILFITTLSSDIWQKIPGLSRVSNINISQDTIVPRLNVIESGLSSINPLQNSYSRFIFGWGHENYLYATAKYYKMEQYKFEESWFDQAHNKLVEVLVTLGVSGLIVYMIFWIIYFKYTVRLSKNFSLIQATLLFYGVAYFTHLFFLFEQISSIVGFLFVCAYIIYSQGEFENEKGGDRRQFLYESVFVFSVVVTFSLSFVFVFETTASYIKMRQYFGAASENTLLEVKKINQLTAGLFSRSQMNIRLDLLVRVAESINTIGDETRASLVERVLALGDEYMELRPNDIRFASTLAYVYSQSGHAYNDAGYLSKGEDYYRRVLQVSPNRPDIIYRLAVNLAYQNKIDESLSILKFVTDKEKDIAESYCYIGVVYYLSGGQNYDKSLSSFEKCFTIKPWLFGNWKLSVFPIYKNFVLTFYENKRAPLLITSLERLIKNGYIPEDNTRELIDYLSSGKAWPVIKFSLPE
jgi:tetratricopeptide (TPR) repeat protein/O-antigen ligase